MKPTIQKIKNARGRIETYRANIGAIEADADGPKESVEICERYALEALARLDRGSHILRWKGHMILTRPTTHGWEYWLDTFSRDDYFCGTYKTREAADDAALVHLASSLWTYQTDDAEFVSALPERFRKDQLVSIKWQREMKRLMDSGLSDNEAREVIRNAGG